jgi:hypothetical protein
MKTNDLASSRLIGELEPLAEKDFPDANDV